MMLRKWYLDNPISRASLFHPRRVAPGRNLPPHIHDGSIETDEVTLGYRLYVHEGARAVVLYFHGNGDVVSDYDEIALLFEQVGATLLVAEYRGYGWSSDQPRGSKLLDDAETTLHHVPDVRKRHDVAELPLFVMGYSLGSAPAIHLAYTHPERFEGLMIQSGFAHSPSAPLWPPLMKTFMRRMPAMFHNGSKMPKIMLPTLILHGERDTVIDVEQAQALYDASASSDKTLLRIPDAHHGSVMLIERDASQALDGFITAHSASYFVV